MDENKDNLIVRKSYSFALQIVKLFKTLVAKKEYVLSKQVLRAGRSVGANIHEAIASESKRDFIHKLGIALKESRETLYWLNLLKDGDYITIDEHKKLMLPCNEIIKIVNSIILTTRGR